MQDQGKESVHEMGMGNGTEIAMRVEADFFDGETGAIVEFLGGEEGLRGDDREQVWGGGGGGKCGMQGRRDREVRGEAADGDGDALGRGMTGDGMRI